ncbi:MAG: SDR family NAD(P)-dependent oxidoreductase [Chloroflexota bacterium]
MTENPAWRHAIVVGASSGIGEAIARVLGAAGTRVVLVARREQLLRSIAASINASVRGELAFPLIADVRDAGSAAGAFQEATTILGGLDLVVYAAGIQPPVGPGEYPTAMDVPVIETNVLGAIAWLNEAAFRFARAGSGTIIGISSVAGDRGRVGSPVYNASKAALDSYLESLHNRLARLHVTVVTAKPGFVQTALLEAAGSPRFPPPISPERAAREILRAAASGKRLVYVPSWWRWIMMIIRHIPSPVFKRLNV